MYNETTLINFFNLFPSVNNNYLTTITDLFANEGVLFKILADISDTFQGQIFDDDLDPTIEQLKHYLTIKINKQVKIDINSSLLLAQHHKPEVFKFIELIVAAAILSENKEKVVISILKLSEMDQKHMKYVIESSFKRLNYEMNHNLAKLDESIAEFDSHSINYDESFISVNSSPPGKNSSNLKNQIEELEVSNYQLSKLVEDLQSIIHQKESENEVNVSKIQKLENVLSEKEHHLVKITEENEMLKDELNVVGHQQLKVKQIEATLASYRTKLADVEVTSTQYSELEQNYEKSLKQILVLEQSNKCISGLKKSQEESVAQISKLETDLAELSSRLKQKEVEIENERDKTTLLKESKKLLESDIEQLKIQLEMSEMEIKSSKGNKQAIAHVQNTCEIIEIREKVMKVEYEKRVLEERIEFLSKKDNVRQLEETIKRFKENLQKKDEIIEGLVSDRRVIKRVEDKMQLTHHSKSKSFLTALLSIAKIVLAIAALPWIVVRIFLISSLLVPDCPLPQ